MMKSALFSLFAFGLLATVQAADPAPAPKPQKFPKVKAQTPEGFTLKTIEIAKYPEHTVELYVYVPDAAGTWPCVIDIHGGGWKARQVEVDKPMMERLAQRGFVTALVSYRLSTEAKYPAALDDCKAALRCLRAHATELKIDPERIGCIGGSAGGHLSGLVAMTTGLKEFEGAGPFKDQSSAVTAAIVMAAPQDLIALYGEKPNDAATLFFGGSGKDLPDVYKAASPITHVRPGVPPTIYIEGEKDSLKVGRAEIMEKLKALGIETALYTLKDAPHPFWMSDPWCAETVEIAAKFFKKHLGEPVLK